MATRTSRTKSAEPVVPTGTDWSIDAARTLYNVEGWGAGFFDINDAGHMIVRAGRGEEERSIDLHDLAHDIQAQGVGLPVLLRFSDILQSRIHALDARFAKAIEEYEYEGTYTTVYPIKVNQQRHVVEEILEFGSKTGVG